MSFGQSRSGFRAFALRDAAALSVVLMVLLCAAALMAASGRGPDRSQRNLAILSTAVAQYAADFGSFPPSYVYGQSVSGPGWNPAAQGPVHPSPEAGYVHWSGLLTALGYVPIRDAFTSPSVERGGAPNANPGPNPAHWEAGQLNDFGASSPAPFPNDRQAKRLAYTANRAIMGRNKLIAGSPRVDRIVGESEPLNPSGTILLTEFHAFSGPQAWRAVQDPDTGVFRSHRPVNPFLGLSAGADVYSEPNSAGFARFRYVAESELLPAAALGPGMIMDQQSATTLNTVARSAQDGRANFAFLDGSVGRFTVQETVRRRLWGSRFHSISGNNAVQP